MTLEDWRGSGVGVSYKKFLGNWRVGCERVWIWLGLDMNVRSKEVVRCDSLGWEG